MEILPVRWCGRMAVEAQIVETGCLPSLASDLLASTRGEVGEEILEVPVAPIEPVELHADAGVQPWLAGERLGFARRDEEQVPARQSLGTDQGGGRRRQSTRPLHEGGVVDLAQQQAWACDWREGCAAHEFRVVALAATLPGSGPFPVVGEFTDRIMLHVERQQPDADPVFVQGQMQRLPALRVQHTSRLHEAEKGLVHDGMVCWQQAGTGSGRQFEQRRVQGNADGAHGRRSCGATQVIGPPGPSGIPNPAHSRSRTGHARAKHTTKGIMRRINSAKSPAGAC